MEILLLISVYALSCNFIFFFLAFSENCGIFSLKIEWERVKNATLFSFFFSVKTAVFDEQLFFTRRERRGGSVCS